MGGEHLELVFQKCVEDDIVYIYIYTYIYIYIYIYIYS